MLFLQFSLFVSVFPNTFTMVAISSIPLFIANFAYALLTIALRVSRIRRTALTYIHAAGFLAAINCSVRCARRPVLVAVHAACAVCCSFVVLTFVFPTATYVIFGKNKQDAYEDIHPIYSILRARRLRRKDPWGERFLTLYSVGVFVAFGSRGLFRAWSTVRSSASFGYQRSKHIINNINNRALLPGLFCCQVGHVEQSVSSSEDRNSTVAVAR